MKLILRTLLCILGVLLSNMIAHAQLSTPQVLSSNMVLQQGQKIPVWGTAEPNEAILISFGKQRVKVRANASGRWMAELKPMAANKNPQQMSIKGKRTSIVYDNIVVGEVWLCSGQSNMVYKMKLPDNYALPAKGENLAALELRKPTNEMIRVFVVRRDNKPVSWKVADGESLAEVSAVGYFFGKALQEQLDVPVGIITAAVNGSRIETWTSKEAYEHSPVFSSQLKEGEGKMDGMIPGERYETMIHPLAPFAIKGCLWYQGESNCMIHDRQYAEKYQVLVDSWREAFNVPGAPFYSVLLAPHLYSNRMSKDRPPVTAEELPIFHQQQIKARSMIPNTDFVVVSDLVDKLRDIHPSYKWKVGERLARVALAKDYGLAEVVWSGPCADKAEVVADSIVVSFGHVADGLKTNNKGRLDWFEIAGKDGVFRPALADIRERNKVVVYHPEIVQPVQVRFGWHETVMPNLVNSEGLPAIPFSRVSLPGK